MINESVRFVKHQLSKNESVKFILEIYEPKYPKKVKGSKVIKPGVQGGKRILRQYQFTTKKGNDVKVQFERDFPNYDKANIVFYVNDTLEDVNKEVDPEILPGVLGIVQKAADRLKLQALTFSAWSGQKDLKYVKGLPENVSKVKEYYNKIIKWLDDHITDEELQASTDIHRPTPSIIYKGLKRKLSELMDAYEANENSFYGFVTDIENSYAFSSSVNKIPLMGEFVNELKKLRDAKVSNTDTGLLVRRNRREAIYDKLMQRFFSNNWNIEKHGPSFTLERKNDQQRLP